MDIARFPNLIASITEVSGYAHLDVDVLDDKGKAVKTLRSPTLTSPGVSAINLRESLDPAVYQLRVRMIVGGPNAGCSASYDWLRFVGKTSLSATPKAFPVPFGGSLRRSEW